MNKGLIISILNIININIFNMTINLEHIKSELKKRIHLHKYIIYNGIDTEEYLNKFSNRIYSICNTNKNLIDVYNDFKQSLPIYYLINTIDQDFFLYNCKIAYSYYLNDINNLITRYFLPYNEVEDRMFIRQELFKEGWDIIQIEKYIITII